MRVGGERKEERGRRNEEREARKEERGRRKEKRRRRSKKGGARKEERERRLALRQLDVGAARLMSELLNFRTSELLKKTYELLKN
ncbi:MAG: hypothetical protein K6C10_09560 [Prevotella sp.]|nr:hypothetical protein [Prevotella sp.]